MTAATLAETDEFHRPKEALQRLEAWLSLPDGDRAELLNGRIVYKANPDVEHGDAVVGISEQIGRVRGPASARGGGWWISSEVDMLLGGQGLRPDLVGWRIDKHPNPPEKVAIPVGDKNLRLYVTPPDWVCEVLSKSTRGRDEDEGTKWNAYHKAEVRHYWLVDLDKEQITVYRRGSLTFQAIDVANFDDVKRLAPFEAVEFEAQRVFIMARVRNSKR